MALLYVFIVKIGGRFGAGDADSFAQALQQLSGVVRQLTKAETAKAEAAAAREHKRMDSFLKEEQAQDNSVSM